MLIVYENNAILYKSRYFFINFNIFLSINPKLSSFKYFYIFILVFLPSIYKYFLFILNCNILKHLLIVFYHTFFNHHLIIPCFLYLIYNYIWIERLEYNFNIFI